MKYTGFEMRRIIQFCKSPKDVQRVADTVWEYPDDHLARHEMAWFCYSLNIKVTELRIKGNE